MLLLLVVCVAALGFANQGFFTSVSKSVYEEVDEEGPPPWANEEALIRAEWVKTDEEGPPPWAEGKGDINLNEYDDDNDEDR